MNNNICEYYDEGFMDCKKFKISATSCGTFFITSNISADIHRIKCISKIEDFNYCPNCGGSIKFMNAKSPSKIIQKIFSED